PPPLSPPLPTPTDRPPTPTIPPYTALSRSLSLSGDTDANGVSVAYEVSSNGGTTWTSTTASQSGLTDGDYLFHAIVTDPAGNSSTSNAVEVKIDTTAPRSDERRVGNETSTGTPNTPAVTTDNAFGLTLSGSADTNGTTDACANAPNGGTTWTSTTASQSGLTDGDYLFHAIVTDPAGNSSTSNAVEVKIDTTAP